MPSIIAGYSGVKLFTMVPPPVVTKSQSHNYILYAIKNIQLCVHACMYMRMHICIIAYLYTYVYTCLHLYPIHKSGWESFITLPPAFCLASALCYLPVPILYLPLSLIQQFQATTLHRMLQNNGCLNDFGSPTLYLYYI